MVNGRKSWFPAKDGGFAQCYINKAMMTDINILLGQAINSSDGLGRMTALVTFRTKPHVMCRDGQGLYLGTRAKMDWNVNKNI